MGGSERERAFEVIMAEIVPKYMTDTKHRSRNSEATEHQRPAPLLEGVCIEDFWKRWPLCHPELLL